MKIATLCIAITLMVFPGPKTALASSQQRERAQDPALGMRVPADCANFDHKLLIYVHQDNGSRDFFEGFYSSSKGGSIISAVVLRHEVSPNSNRYKCYLYPNAKCLRQEASVYNANPLPEYEVMCSGSSSNTQMLPVIIIGDQNPRMGGLVAQAGSAGVSEKFHQQIEVTLDKEMLVSPILHGEGRVTAARLKGITENNPKHMWYSKDLFFEFRQL